MTYDEKKVDSLFQLMQIMEGNIYKFQDVTYDEINQAFKEIKKIAILAKTKQNPNSEIVVRSLVWGTRRNF